MSIGDWTGVQDMYLCLSLEFMNRSGDLGYLEGRIRQTHQAKICSEFGRVERLDVALEGTVGSRQAGKILVEIYWLGTGQARVTRIVVHVTG